MQLSLADIAKFGLTKNVRDNIRQIYSSSYENENINLKFHETSHYLICVLHATQHYILLHKIYALNAFGQFFLLNPK